MADAFWVDIRVPTAGEKWRLVLLGDVHKGAPGHAATKFRADVKMIKETPNCYWLGMGDYVDCITHNDRKRFNPKHFKGSDYQIADLANLPKIQCEEFLHDVDSIKSQCVGLLEGNHEWQNPKYNAYDVMADIQEAIGAPFLGVSGFLKFRVIDDSRERSHENTARYIFSLWAHHGYGCGRLAGGHALTLQRLVMTAQGVNAYAMGHRHQHLIFPSTAMYADNSRPKPRVREFPTVSLMTGGYLMSYREGTSDYAEQLGLMPVVLGAPWIDIWGSHVREPGASGASVGYVPVYHATHTPLVGGGLLAA